MRTKEFDAVQMKRDLQEKVRLDNLGLSDEQRREKLEGWLEASDHPLAVLWRSIPDSPWPEMEPSPDAKPDDAAGRKDAP